MVNFGKSIVKAQRQGWQQAYLNYDELKDIVSEIEQELTERESVQFADAFTFQPKKRSLDELLEAESPAKGVERLKQRFLNKLREEIEKLSLFILQQQGSLADSVGASRFGSTIFSKKNDAIVKAPDVESAVLDPKNLLDHYSILGVELLHLLKFVCVNSIGVQKILKKYNKCFERFDEANYVDVNGDHLQQLAYSPSIRAIEASLQWALMDSISKLSSNANAAAQLKIIRFQCVMSCNDRLRRNAELLQQPFLDFLSRQAMILTGTNLGGMEERSKKALKWLIQLQPEKLLTMNEAQLEDLWSQWSEGPSNVQRKQTKPKPSHRRKTSLADFVSHTRGHSLATLGEEAFEEIMKEELSWGGVDSPSMALNLLSTLLYTINYYIIAPTANHYAIMLETDGAFGSTLIGASSFSAIFAAFFYSLWYTKSSFKSALIFSAIFPVFGNLIYALASSFNSMPMAIFGRILCGFGSAEVVNRQLISACVNFEGMTKASALFVAAGAVGMSVGPLLAGILEITTGRDEELDIKVEFLPAGGLIWNHLTSPGFVMAGLWLLELVALIFLFSEPSRINGSGDNDSIRTTIAGLDDSARERSDEDSPLLTNKKGYSSLSENLKERKTKKLSTGSLWGEAVTTLKLIVQNPGLPLTLVIFGYIEMTDEVLISSCAMVTRRYFGLHGTVAGFLIASLGALVLPAHFVVEKASHYYSERNIISKSLVFLVVSLLGIMNWSGMYLDIAGALESKDYDNASKHEEIAGQELKDVLTIDGEFYYDFGIGPSIYVFFLSAVFMGTIVLEGVDTSIMAKVTPSELNDRFFNCGLLATLVGTLGRVFADGMITLSALLDIHILMDFVNATFVPILILTVAGLYLVSRYYSHLV